MCKFDLKLEDATYSELKNLLKIEYLVKFKKFVELSVDEKEKLIIDRFGKEFYSNRERVASLKEKIDFDFDEFYKSKNYQDAQTLVASLNQKILTCSENEKKQVEEDIKKALSKIETLNVTIKNRTQKEREELETLKKSVEEIESANKDELEKLDKQVEGKVIKKLAETFPDLSAHLLSFEYSDPQPLFKKGYYYAKAMGASFSLKSVLPALYPDEVGMNYNNLEGSVKNGMQAMSAFLRASTLLGEELEQLKEDLVRYCALDTYAVVKIVKKLYEVI